jgi:hypothetical protein
MPFGTGTNLFDLIIHFFLVFVFFYGELVISFLVVLRDWRVRVVPGAVRSCSRSCRFPTVGRGG